MQTADWCREIAVRCAFPASANMSGFNDLQMLHSAHLVAQGALQASKPVAATTDFRQTSSQRKSRLTRVWA
jgi:hypothetical protein